MTKIEWCDETWNPITGCTPISAGCERCYAKKMSNRLRGRFGYPADDPFKVTFHPDKIDINIHPTKTEIKFEDSPAVFQMVRASVKAAILAVSS